MTYLDYNANTPIDEEVADAMLPYLYGQRLFRSSMGDGLSATIISS